MYRWQRGKWERKSFLPLAEKVFGTCAMSDRCVLSVSKDGVLYAAGVVCKRGGALGRSDKCYCVVCIAGCG